MSFDTPAPSTPVWPATKNGTAASRIIRIPSGTASAAASRTARRTSGSASAARASTTTMTAPVVARPGSRTTWPPTISSNPKPIAGAHHVHSCQPLSARIAWPVVKDAAARAAVSSRSASTAGREYAGGHRRENVRRVRFSADRPLGVAPATINDYRELARRRLPRQLFDYIDGGAYEETTMRANVSDLEGVLLRQVVMRDVSVREQRVEVLGQQLAMPVVLAPVGLGGMFAPRAEVQAARAAEATGIPFIESTVSICSIEEVAKATSQPPWFQLYVMRDRSYAEDLMARAHSVGAPVLVLTIDLAVVGARHRDTRNAIVSNPTTWGKVRRGLDIGAHPGWIRDTALGGKPLTFGNLEKAVPGAGAPEGFKDW